MSHGQLQQGLSQLKHLPQGIKGSIGLVDPPSRRKLTVGGLLKEHDRTCSLLPTCLGWDFHGFPSYIVVFLGTLSSEPRQMWMLRTHF